MKRKKKWRFWALLLTSAMLAGSLTACGDQAGEGQTQDPESKTESGGAESKEESD